VFLPEAIKKLYNIEKPSGYPKFFVVQALTYVFLENFRDSSWIGVQPQEEQKFDGDDSDNGAKNLEDMTPILLYHHENQVSESEDPIGVGLSADERAQLYDYVRENLQNDPLPVPVRQPNQLPPANEPYRNPLF
jgi:hypothetical protein